MDRLTAIQVFNEVVASRSFSLAAKNLDMSRAMVTRHISTLEDWLGARLLQRSTRQLTLTEAGNNLLRQGRQVLQLIEQIEVQQARQKDQLSGNLRLACCVALSTSVLTAMLTQFASLHPNLKIELCVDDQVVNLIEQRIDLAIRISAAPAPNLVASVLGPCDSVLVAAPAYLLKAGKPEHPQDLRHHICLSYANFGKHLWSLQRGNQRLDIPIQSQLSADETTVVLAYALNGGGIALQPRFLVDDLVQQGKLTVLLEDWQAPRMMIYALYSSRRHLAPAVRTLLDFLRLQFASQRQ